MQNYVCINGEKIELTAEQIAEITKSAISVPVKLSDKAHCNSKMQITIGVKENA